MISVLPDNPKKRGGELGRERNIFCLGGARGLFPFFFPLFFFFLFDSCSGGGKRGGGGYVVVGSSHLGIKKRGRVMKGKVGKKRDEFVKKETNYMGMYGTPLPFPFGFDHPYQDS